MKYILSLITALLTFALIFGGGIGMIIFVTQFIHSVKLQDIIRIILLLITFFPLGLWAFSLAIIVGHETFNLIEEK